MPLKLTQRHGSPYWYIRGSIRGVRVDESTGLSERREAEEVLIKRSGEILTRSIHGDAVSRTFAEAALSYMQHDGEKDHLTPLLKHFAETPLARIGQHEIELAAKKLKPGVSNATLNRQIYTPISAVLYHAARKGWCPKPVIARPKQPEGRMRWVTFEEADKLIAAAAPHLEPLVIFLFCTGARISEALYLDWRDVDLSACHVNLIDTKNGESRGVPLHPRAVAALANLPWARTGAVFRRPAGKIKKAGRVWLPYEDREGEGGGQVKTAWAGMLRRAGISDFTPHDCRHTWATWHYMANRDIRALMELGGWKSPDMVIRYAHVNTSHLAPSINKIWGKDGETANRVGPKRMIRKLKIQA
jgi:integrase